MRPYVLIARQRFRATDRSEVTANDLRTAYHEAGHAVIAFALRRRIKRISIEATATVSTTTLRPEQLKRRERDVVIAYGGLAAEGKYSGRVDPSATLDDQRIAVETTTDVALRRGEDPVVVLKPRLQAAFRQAVDLIDRHWIAVEALAHELVVRGSMGQGAAYRFLQARVDRD